MNTGTSRILSLLLLLLITGIVCAQEVRILVFYPMDNKSLGTVYTSTIKGIKNKVDRLIFFEIPETASLTDIQAEIDRHHPDKIIALGNQAVDIINKSNYRNQALAGLMYFAPSEHKGVSLALDSRVLLKYLQRLAPRIKRVFIVQNSNRRVISRFSSTMTSSPLLVNRESNDSLTNMRILGKLLEQEATADDAILLPAHIPKDILYEVSKIAWDKNIMLLSTNLTHLEYGAMLVFYPNLVALGEQLGDLANQQTITYETVKSVDISLNKRVAQHLGIKLNPSLLNLFSVILN